MTGWGLGVFWADFWAASSGSGSACGFQNGTKVKPALLDSGSYIVAVSGGVDSVVLLDMLTNSQLPTPTSHLIVAHFDHGIREDSAEDARFVGELARTHGLQYESRREELGVGASEELARDRRYGFLRELAQKYDAQIVTAHHADDVVETIAINVSRGTGWRGVAVLDSLGIVRPLLHLRKQELVAYAEEHRLKWHEDSTNISDTYLRNRMRRKMSRLDEDDRQLLVALRGQQVEYKRLIDEEAQRLVGQSPYSRHFFTVIDQTVAVELLRAVFVRETGSSPTEPQRQLALAAVKVARPGAAHDVGSGVRLRFTRTQFVVEKG